MSAPRSRSGHGPRGRRRDEGGYALVTVLGAVFVLTLVSLAALGSAVQGMPGSRKAQDSEAALAAAQAGVADLVTRINLCRDYWLNPSGCDATEFDTPDAEGWSVLDPTADPAHPRDLGEYRVRYLVTPEPLNPPVSPQPAVSPGLIRAEVTGRVNGVERVVTADLRQPGFLQYIYYTDFESMDPVGLMKRFPPRRYDTYTLRVVQDGTTKYVDFTDVTFSGISQAEAQKCYRYYYGPSHARNSTDLAHDARPKETFTGTYGTGGQASVQSTTLYRSCEIAFSGDDDVKGPLHTNDALLIQNGTQFFSPQTQTSWPNAVGTVPAPNTAAWYRTVTSTDTPGAGYWPVYAEPVTLPEQAEDLPQVALRGCLYTGPTSLEFLDWTDLPDRTDELKLRVHSPFSRDLAPGCGGAAAQSGPTDIVGPANGVVHVRHRSADPYWATSGCTGKVLGKYPVDDTSFSPPRPDITPYDCTEGDAFVQGRVKGSFTVSAANDVVITDDLTYAGGLTGSDVLGLVAEGNVEVYHPVTCEISVTAPKVCPEARYKNLPANGSEATSAARIDAAVISMDHSFTVQNYDKGPALGTITVRGGIYQRFRGPMGTVLDVTTASTPSAQVPKLLPTGFTGKDYQYDDRLRNVPPPAFPVPAGVQWSPTAFTEQTCAVTEPGCSP